MSLIFEHDELPAISLWQPWATLIACGAKRYETRSWSTLYRGPMAIHAGKKWNHQMSQQCYERPFFELLRRNGFRIPMPWQETIERFGLPFGAILAVAELVDLRPAGEVLREIGGEERAFGDFTHGRYAWEYSNVVRLEHAIPCPGKQGIFRLEPRVLELVKRAMGPVEVN